MNYKIGFIGMGSMGCALADGFIKKGLAPASNISAFAPNQDKLKSNSEAIGFIPKDSLQSLCESSDILIMACKPDKVKEVLKAAPLTGKALLSIAAGWDFDKYQEALAEKIPLQYIMPNTPAKIGKGVFLFEKKNSFDSQMRDFVIKLFRGLGSVEELESGLMKIGMAISGCGPAFADLMMEAFGDAAVKYGIPRETAYRLIARTLEGSAALQAESGLHPGVLKDQVSSPAGTTIVGVSSLEEHGFRNACIKAIDAIMALNTR